MTQPLLVTESASSASDDLRPAQREQRNRTRVVCDSILVAFLMWLTVNPLVTVLSPSISAWVQAAMLGHRATGLAFVCYLVFYLPVHLLFSGDFSLRSFGALVGRVRVPLAILASYLVVAALADLGPQSPLMAVVVVAFAWGLFRKETPIRRRVLELVMAAAAFITDAINDPLGRLLILMVLVHAVWQVLMLVWRSLRDKTRSGDSAGHLAHYATILMAMFGYVTVHGTGSMGPLRGPYVRHVAHIGTVVAFLGLLAGHFVQVIRRPSHLHGPRTLVRWRVVGLTMAVLALVELGGAIDVHRYATAVVDTRAIKPRRVTPYTRLEGYDRPGAGPSFGAHPNSCNGFTDCHGEVSAQHDISAHGRAFVDQKFQKQLGIFIAEKGRPAADYCLTCHAPLGVIAHPGDGSRGAVVDPLTTQDPTFTAGVTCVVCHRATPRKQAAEVGTGSMAIRPLWLDPERFLGEDDASPDALSLHQLRMIATAVQLHAREYHIAKSDADYICAACHVVDLPASLADDGRARRVADQYTSFAHSPYARAGHTCASCHQPWMRTYKDGDITAAHNYPGSGTALPSLAPAEDATVRASSLAFLKGLGDIGIDVQRRDQLTPCLSDLQSGPYEDAIAGALRQRGPANPFTGTAGGLRNRDILQVRVERVAAPSGTLALRVDTTNACDGHTFPSGGGVKGYLTIEVHDRQGRLVGTYGGLDRDGHPLDLPTNLGGRAADVAGKPIVDRRFWRAHTVTARRAIAPGQTLVDQVTIVLGAGLGPYTVDARWNYLRPEVLRDLEEGGGRHLPSVVIGTWHGVLAP